MAQTSKEIIDTDVLIDYLRILPKAKNFLDSLQIRCISAVTAMEIIQGSRNQRELETNLLFLGNFNVIKIDGEVSDLAIELMKKYKLKNNLLIPDALIAATAIKSGGELLTKNLKHFKFIKELEVKSPY